jgi:hypothetical protein
LVVPSWTRSGWSVAVPAQRIDARLWCWRAASQGVVDAIGHAVADSPLGPFTKTPQPILASNEVAAGLGHCALVRKSGKVWMLYHAWPPDAVGTEMPGRNLWLSEVTFAADGSVTVTPPTVEYPTRP